LALDGTTPGTDARILLEPGTRATATQADGSFRLNALPAGEYRIRVLRVGMVEARDSVFLTGRNGLRLLVTLVEHDLGLREC